MKYKLYILLLVLVIISIAIFSTFKKQSKFVLGKVQLGTITELVSESGAVSTNSNVPIYSISKGMVDKVYVNNGDTVKERQKLFSVKSTASSQERAEAYSIYETARIALQQAENNHRATVAIVDRVHDDVRGHDKDESFAQKEARTTAEVQNDNAYIALTSAKAQLASAQLNYYSTLNSTITSPISGTISNLSVSTGSVVMPSGLSDSTTPLALVGNSDNLEIVISVGETDINKIKIGQEAEVKFDAIENKIFKGAVVRFDENGTSTQGVAKYNIYISLYETNKEMKPGMNVDVDIVTKTLENIIVVPNTAIKPYQKGRAVRVLDKNNNIQFIPVKTGIKGKDDTQILEGLSEGQEIVLSLANEKEQTSGFFKL